MVVTSFKRFANPPYSMDPIQWEEAIVFLLLLILSLGGVMRQCAPGKLESLCFTGVGIERFLSTFLRGDLTST